MTVIWLNLGPPLCVIKINSAMYLDALFFSAYNYLYWFCFTHSLKKNREQFFQLITQMILIGILGTNIMFTSALWIQARVPIVLH